MQGGSVSLLATSPIMLLTCPCTATTLKFDMLRLVYETTFNTPKGIFAEDLYFSNLLINFKEIIWIDLFENKT